MFLLSAVRLSAAQSGNPQVYVVLPKDDNSKKDVKWAEYLVKQARNRVKDISMIRDRKCDIKDVWTVYVHIDNTSKNDYSIFVRDNELELSASSDRNMLWLIYQWIAKISERDHRWEAKDLDPAIIDLSNTQKKFDFGYRSIYSSAMDNPEKIAISGDQHVDYDWGLWGHNLKRVFKNKEIPLDAMATVDGMKTNRQFCFSSEVLAKSISEYISELYGKGEDGNPGWFAIIPNDNMDVCMCEKCKKKGNTPQSATPAVTSLIVELAREFPNHNFYTSAYNTTMDAPANKLPDNAGVIISAIDLPMNTAETNSSGYLKWKERLQKWKSVTDKIIIWDYMRNFDDYLTPYPCLFSIQNRLNWFKEMGIYGVFYNGSGDDYSSFDDIQTYVVSALLKNTEVDIESLIKRYLENNYPQSGQVIFDYYSKLENSVKQNHITLEWYAGIDYALQTYLNVNDFRKFYVELDRISKQTGEDERRNLNMLLTALDFTQLEIIRSGYCMNDKTYVDKSGDFLELLNGFRNFKNMDKYKEAYGHISEYIDSWNTIDFYKPREKSRITINGGNGNEKLTDGYYGFAYDYHLHWRIFDKGKNEINIDVKEPGDELEMVLSFLNASKWKIGLPSKIEVYQNNILKGRWISDGKTVEDFSIMKARIWLNTVAKEGLKILIYRGHQKKIACDEIEVHRIKKNGNEI